MTDSPVDDPELFRGIFDSTPDAVVVVDLEGTIVLANAQCLPVFGYQPGELLGRPIEDLVPPRLRRGHPARRDGFVNGGERRPMGLLQLEAVRCDGTVFPAEVSLAPLDVAGGHFTSATVRDTTERLRLQRETDRVRDDVIATVSHELRTPLTSIIGYTELMSDLADEDLGAAARRLLAVIERNAVRELRLVNDLLTLASLGQERMPVTLMSVDLATVVRNAVETARVAARGRGVTVEVTDAGVPRVHGDAQRLGQVVDNLLANALKFTPPGGRVELRVTDGGDEVVLEVEDTGLGIRPADLDRIFDRLYRTTDAQREQVPGAGLGLPIVKAIVDAHGGSVSAECEPGRGALLRVRLPYADPASPGG